MIVECENCHAKYKLADEKVTPRGVKIRCSKCSHVFVVRKPEEESIPLASGSTKPGDSGPFGGFDFGEGSPGNAPSPSKPSGRVDQVFNPDLSGGRQMEVDMAPSAAGGAKTDPFSDLDQLFGGSKAAAKPSPAPAAPSKAPPKAEPAGGDLFSDAVTLNTAGTGTSKSAGGSSDPFEGLFTGSGAEEAQPPPDEPSAASSGEDFNTLISGADDFFKDGKESEKPGLGGDEPSADAPGSPSVQWGPRKVVNMEGANFPWVKVVAPIVIVIGSIIGFRASIEFAPAMYLDSGMSYETVSGVRDAIPFFPDNSDFPEPPRFWELQIDKTFFIENQFGKKIFAAAGRVTNKGSGKRSFFSIEAQALDATGKTVSLPEKVFAGNELDEGALKRLPVGDVRKALSVRIGKDGVNIDVPPNKSLPFMIVFADFEREPASVQVLRVDAIGAGN